VTSAAKISANRANARASTGPKTPHGRARAARNAFRHGLSLPVCSDPILSDEVDALAREIAGTNANPEIQDLAHRVAEAQIDVRRVRCARHRFLSSKLSESFYEALADSRRKLAFSGRCFRPGYAEGLGLTMDDLERILCTTPQGPEKFALIISQEAKKLSSFDRYEQRQQF
jgi:hypothetical protein